MGYADFASPSSTCVRIIQALSSCCVDTPKAQRLGKKNFGPHTYGNPEKLSQGLVPKLTPFQWNPKNKVLAPEDLKLGYVHDLITNSLILMIMNDEGDDHKKNRVTVAAELPVCLSEQLTQK